MSRRLWILRVSCLITLAIWVGGFTVYGGIVVPILHEEIGASEAVHVTRQVTDALNMIGVVAVALWWSLEWFERGLGLRVCRLCRGALLSVSTGSLVTLMALHKVMEFRLASGSMGGFARLHRMYLLTSTIQWAANLGIIAASLWLWGRSHRSSPPSSSDGPIVEPNVIAN
jgi:hypothetical protein